MRTIKYQKPGSSTFYTLRALAKRYPKQYESVGRDDGKFGQLLCVEMGFKSYFM